MKKINKKWIVAAAAAIVILAGFAYIRSRAQAGIQALLGDLQTEEITRGSLVATVGATGTVRAQQSATLLWQASGTVDQVHAAVGDVVQAGDMLASLAQTSLSQNVILAQAELVSAQKALDDLYKAHSGVALALAGQRLADAEKIVQDTQHLLDNLNTPARQTDIDQAQANVVLAEFRLDKARDKFAPYENKPEDNLIRASLLSHLADAQEAYDAAVRTLNFLLGTASPTDIAIAEADLQLAQAQLAEAQEEYDRLLAGPTAAEIAAAEARVAAAQATLNLSAVHAPFSGTVTAAHPIPGDQVSPSMAAFRLDDLANFLVDVQVSEIDINRIALGQPVILTFDAILAKEYSGEVVEVGLAGEVQQGVVNFNITVKLLDADEDVKPGMTAAVNIVVSQLEQALLVPNRAVRVLNGKRVVFIIDQGNLKPVEIILGASSETHSQVLEGELNIGDNVVLNPPADFHGPGGPGGPGGGPFGGR